jgi:GDPmannose 4,6-dehydratase
VETLLRALITTAYGQDSIFLGRLLRSKGYKVLVLNHREGAPFNYGHFDGFVNLDITRTDQIVELISAYKPAEVYNLAALSSVAYSWVNPDLVKEVNGFAVERLLSRFKNSNVEKVKFFQAGSTDMVGKKIVESRESEFNPWSPYGKSKEIARQAVVNARTKSGLWAVNAILTNHDSEYRSDGFVIPQIANQLIEVLNGNRDHVDLQNPFVSRDWAHAEDVMEAAWKMMQNTEPVDFTLGTGLSLSLNELVDKCSSKLKISPKVTQSVDSPVRKNDFDSIQINALEAQVSLKWAPRRTGEETLLSIIEHKRIALHI